LANDEAGETEARRKALAVWKTNPEVDHLIGLKLSQKYRFAEGAAYQRKALEMDAAYLPAKIQLAQDLLRLGDESEGWGHAEAVHQKDGYDVTAFNLVTLKDTIGVRHDHQRTSLRMEGARRWYGARSRSPFRARRTLRQYGIELDSPTTVEIFHRQSICCNPGMPGNPLRLLRRRDYGHSPVAAQPCQLGGGSLA
jgi:hypothetical protein